MVKNVKLKRKAKKLRNLRIVWYLVIDSEAMLLYQSYLASKHYVDMADNVRKHIVSIYKSTLEDILKSKIRLRKQIIKCKTK